MADALYSNAGRLIGGNPKAKRVPGTVASAIYAGDFLVLAASKASPASSLTDSGTKAQNQEAAHDVFLGVSLDAKPAGDTRDVTVASAGEFKYPCASLGQAYDIGTFFGMAGTGSAGAVGVADQIVEPVASAALAVGKLSRNAASGDTAVYLEILAAVTSPTGGPQEIA